MRPARRPTPDRYAAVADYVVDPQRSHPCAINDNALPDRAALIVVAIGQVSAVIASISGIAAAALLLAR